MPTLSLAFVALVVFAPLGPPEAHAIDFGLPIDPSNFDPDSALPSDLKEVLALTVGVTADHRAQAGADALNDVGIGVELGIQVSLVKTPPDLGPTLAKYDIGGGDLPFLPMAKATVAKGFGKRVDIGLSLLAYSGKVIAGGDFKLLLWNAEEGPAVAFRLAYTSASFDPVFTDTWTPQLVVSRRLAFADPYLGLGVNHVLGRIVFKVDGPTGPATIEGTTEVSTFLAFIGVGFRLGPTGLKLGIEGTYSSADMSSLTTKIGMQF
ncbi:MAG: hypothetical protein IT285_05550 [Bdellovibrionales bacterium]|nr:hypothetical protein [Bdellovibrionales bacterium]